MIKFLYEKLWKDSVISKLIAEAIKHWFLMLSISGGISGLMAVFWSNTKTIFYYLISDPLRITVIILIIVIILLLLIIFLRKPQPKASHYLTPLEWFKKQNLNDYYFLLWFAAKNTLRTESYPKIGLRARYGDVSYKAIPEIRKLLENNVIRYENPTFSDYCFEIDGDVLQYLKDSLKEIQKNEKSREIINQFPHIRFQDFFPEAITKSP